MPKGTTVLSDEARYLTDDRDADKPYELVIRFGGNGDWYVSVVPQGEKAFHGVRISTSGGASHAAPGLTLAIAQAYNAIIKANT
jgi:hypothetical protein